MQNLFLKGCLRTQLEMTICLNVEELKKEQKEWEKSYFGNNKHNMKTRLEMIRLCLRFGSVIVLKKNKDKSFQEILSQPEKII